LTSDLTLWTTPLGKLAAIWILIFGGFFYVDRFSFFFAFSFLGL